ncbi:ATP synthase F1 subunit delta [Asticcacaulis sp. AC402]|uniref:ATP synthase F1 subunit delta n=1 Tax=Asticcacaulis sp. AC402 TaxID=1282361 RepID=UPI0004CE8AA0|nr:ATP synthase F1 subunit delta [Asticcacaulis sp. AC402]
MNDQYRETEAGQRYARAAFDLALETKVLDKVHGDMAALKDLLLSSAELRTFVSSLIYKSAVKLSALTAVTQSLNFNALTSNLLGVMAANGRLGELFPVITAFNKRYALHNGVVTAEVISAVPLTAAQLDSLKTTLAQALGQSAEINTHVDPALLGGLKVRLGSRLFDASLKTKLDSLKFALKRA